MGASTMPSLAARTVTLLVLLAGDVLARPYDRNPFGMIGAEIGATDTDPPYANPGYSDAVNLGVHWNRTGRLYAYFWSIDANLQQPPAYNWAALDAHVQSVPSTIRPFGNLIPYNEFNYSRVLPGTYFPRDEQRYRSFVRAVVERYDGDGVGDMPNLVNPIKVWQVANEPDSRSRSRFHDLQRITYEEVKAADFNSQVVIGGATAEGPIFIDGWKATYDARFVPILNALQGRYVDVMDVHWYGAQDSDYRMRDGNSPTSSVLAHVRSTLTSAGFSPNLPIWITELGTVSGWPILPSIPRTEIEMARDLVKKINYLGALGVEKLFANGMMEGFFNRDEYFDHTGYLYDGRGSYDLGLGVPKLAYYTYKLLSEKLSDADWDSLTIVRDGTGGDNLFVLTIDRGGTPVWIAWWDYFADPNYVPGARRSLPISGVPSSVVRVTDLIPDEATGSAVDDYSSAFRSITRAVIGGGTTISLGEIPVVVEASTRSACGNGVVETGEACDDGNGDDEDGCDNDCHVSLCRNGGTLEKVQLEVKGIGGPPGTQKLSLQGLLRFPTGTPLDLNLTDLGAQVYVAGMGIQPIELIDLSVATQSIPPGSRGTGCDRSVDGWTATGRRSFYRNRSNAINPPVCSSGSARGLKYLSFADRRDAQLGAIKWKLQAKGLTIFGDRSSSEIDDAIRVTLVLGRTATAGSAGKCATVTLANCSRFLTLKCKTT